jgi:hypothetical protein
MEEQGIMGLAPQAVGAAPPMPPMPPQGMMPPEMREASAEEQAATADLMYQARKEMSKSDISKDIMAGAAEADPREVEMFKQALSANPLPPELIDALLQMIQLIYENPQDYAAIRQELLAEGVPAELLPEQLDLGFFTSLEMALYEVPRTPTEQGIGAMAPPDLAPTAAPPMAMPPQGFAEGGIVSLKPIAKEMQKMGRYGDTILAHINPQEARMLKAMGGSGTINPYTGLPEFFLKKAAKAVGKVVGGAAKAVGKAVSGAAKAVGSAVKGIANTVKKFASSTVGRIVTTVALGFLVGPAAANFLGVSSVAGVAAVSGFIGSGGATLLGGGSVKDALKAGVTGAVLAGAGATALNGGSAAWATNSYTGPTTISGQWNRITDSVSKAFSSSPTDAVGAPADPFATTSGAPTTPDQALAQGDMYASARNVTGTMTDVPTVDTLEISNISGPEIDAAKLFDQRLASGAPFPGAEADAAALFDQRLASGVPFPGETGITPVSPLEAQSAAMFDQRLASGAPFPGEAAAAAPISPTSAAVPTGGYETTADYANLMRTSGAGPTQGGMYVPGESALPEGVYLKGQVPTGASSSGASFFESPLQATKDFYNTNISPSGIQQAATQNANKVYLETLQATNSEAMALQAAKDSMPGFIQKYGPMAAVGTGATALLLGATTPEQPPLPTDFETTGVDLLAQSPETYGVNLGNVQTSYIQQLQNSYVPPTLAQVQAPTLAPMQSPMFAAAAPAAPATRTFNMGGFVGNQPTSGIGAFGMGYKRGGMPTQYPRKVGAINGPGTATSDSIPAMLSDGEFVFTAKAVRGMGNGSRREGAKKMYAMMRALEGNA